MSMKQSASELAIRISRALISASNQSIPTRTWTPKLEQTLHGLGCRHSLNPTLVSGVIDPFLINHHSLALGFFDWASQQPGFAHTPSTYQSILKSLSIARQFNSVDKLLKQVKAQKIVLHPSAYRSVIASLIIGKRSQNAFLVFREVRGLICKIGPDTCNSLLAALSSDGNVGCAREVFDEMLVSGVSLSTIGFGVFLWRFCRSADYGKILSLVDEVRKGDCRINGSIVGLLVVHGLCLESRVQEAMYILDELRVRNCKPDFMAYRIVAEALRLAGNVVDMHMILKKKRKLGVAPRASDYREFIFDLISERLICEVKELGEVIVRGDFPIEDDVLNALIGSVSNSGPCSALLFFDYLLRKNKFPTLLTLSNLSRSLCKHEKTDELLKVFEILSAKDYFVDTESYNVMISFFCKVGKVREAYQVLQEMKKKGLCPDVSSYNSIMEACCRDELIRPAKRLWDEMFANGCGGNLKTYNILIRKFSEIGQVEDAHRLFCQMLGKGVAPDTATYAFLLKGLCQETQLGTALQIFSKSIEQDVHLARKILCTFILYLCKEGHFIAASNLLLHRALDIGHSDSHVILLKCLADAGQIPIAIEHIKRVGENFPLMLPTVHTELSTLLSSYSKSEPLLLLIQLAQEKQLLSNNEMIPSK